MEKKLKNKREEVIRLLSKQKIREVKDLESYKLSVCHPSSAGIDLGSREVYVGLNPLIAAEMGLPVVHRFDTFTSGLLACRDLLVDSGVTTVAMESTSIYWTTIYSILTQAGTEVCLVNPKKFRMVPGRKTDILDCQWLQTLHLYGLLRGSFHPEEKISQLRSYMRERDRITKDRSRYVQRMQKALVKMNLLLPNVVDDITGKTGLSIIESILKGERNPEKLASLRDGRCKKSEEEIAGSLNGYYKTDQLYLLKLNYDAFTFFDKMLADVDSQITELLKSFPLKEEATTKCPDSNKSKYPRRGKNDLRTKDDLRDVLFHITGTDLTAITGLQTNTILQVISEVGTDMSKFPTANHFASYLGFAPHNKITGGHVLSSRTDRIKSPAAQAFKKVIPSISQSKTALGAFYRRLAPRIGKGKAIVAVCRKLAIIFYNTLVSGTPFVDHGQEQYIKRQEQREKAILQKLAKKHHMLLQSCG
jgi:transposase